MDLTIEVMLPVRGATGSGQSVPANPSYRLLAIVAVYPMKTLPVVGMQCTGYVHVTDVPERAGWAALTTTEVMRRISNRLCKVWENTVGEMVERREFAGIASLVPLNARRTLLDERQITVTWTQFKNFVQNVKEARELSDEDLGD